MFTFKDLSFYLTTVILFFIFLIIFNYLGFSKPINLFITALAFGTATYIYVMHNKNFKKYFILIIAFYILVFFMCNSTELLIIYSGITAPPLLSYVLQQDISMQDIINRMISKFKRESSLQHHELNNDKELNF